MMNLSVTLRFAGAILAEAILMVSCSTAIAQEQGAVSVVPLKTLAQAGPATALSPSLRRDIVPGGKVTVVTVAQPLVRQKCNVESFEGEKLVCGLKSGAGPGSVAYSAVDLVAVIKPEYEFRWPSPLRILSKFGFGGGAIAGAAVLAGTSMVAAVPLAIIGTVFLLDAAFQIADDEAERPREKLIYKNPDQLLQIALK